MKLIKNIPNIFSKKYIEQNSDKPFNLFLGFVLALVGSIVLFYTAIPIIYFSMYGFGY
jgi:hypothetical protein